MISKKINHYHMMLITVFFFTWGFIFLDRNTLSYLTPLIVGDLHLNNAQVAQINMMQTIGYAISAPLIGALSDRTAQRKWWLIFSIIFTAIFAGLSSVSNSMMSLLILRTLVGASEGPILPLIVTLVIPFTSKKSLGQSLGTINAGASIIANTVGPTLTTQVAIFTNWRFTFLIICIPSLILGAIIWKFIREPNVKIDNSNSDVRNDSIINRCFSVFKYRNIIIALLAGLFCMTSMWIFYSFGPLYLTKIGGYSVQQMGYTMSAMGIVGILWTILVPLLSDLFGRRLILILFSFLSAVTPLCLYLFPTSWMGIISVILFGGVIGAMPFILFTLIPADTVPPELTATSSALIMGFSEICGAIILGISGSIADIYGLHTIMIIGLLSSCMMGIISFGFKPKQLKTTVNAKKPLNQEGE